MERAQVQVDASTAGNREAHMAQLDGLRAFAAGAVLVQHSLPVPEFSVGLAGVKLFFVLSGFLITGILVREREHIHARGAAPWRVMGVFYGRRFLRIFPLYYAVLLAAVLFQIPNMGRCLPWHVSYATNYLVAYQGDFSTDLSLAHFWSLGVEEQFYLLWPSLLLLAPRRWLTRVLIALTVLAPLSRVVVLFLTRNVVSAEVIMPSCLDSLGLGGLLAVCWHHRAAVPGCRRFARVCLATGLVAILVLRLGPIIWKGYTVRLVLEDTAMSLVFVWLVAGAATGFRGLGRVLLGSRPLVYLGTISYGIYVYQGVVPKILESLGCTLPKYPSVGALVVLPLITIPVAVVSWHLFEKPLNNLKRFLPYGRVDRLESRRLGNDAPRVETEIRAAQAC
jgi:peptidoglycan/LPS O-acetylase OafA/YrhL